MGGVKTGAKLMEKPGKGKPRLAGLCAGQAHGLAAPGRPAGFLAGRSICLGSGLRHRI